MTQPAKLFVIAAPSGAGKTTLVNAVVDRDPSLRFSVSYTTRKPRKNEVEAKDYFFVDSNEFERLKTAGELLESALVFDNHYGTGRSQVAKHIEDGHNVILEIDWQGAAQVRKSMPDSVSIFILPPSRAELERRLRDRKTDSDEVIERRLRDALSDMSHWDEFDYVIVNDELGDAVAKLESVFTGNAEGSRSSNPATREHVQQIVQ